MMKPPPWKKIMRGSFLIEEGGWWGKYNRTHVSFDFVRGMSLLRTVEWFGSDTAGEIGYLARRVSVPSALRTICRYLNGSIVEVGLGAV